MPVEKVTFNDKWFDKFVSKTNEKDILLNKINDLISGQNFSTCLEIGLGTSPHFAKKLCSKFNQYTIIEKEPIEQELPEGVEFINGSWENTKIKEKYDVIIASHVLYYFDSKKNAIKKMLNSLSDEGIIIFVVNGKTADYGPLKLAFSNFIGEEYKFTYDELLNLLKHSNYREYTIPSTINFDNYEDLFDTLKLSFDKYPEEYVKLKDKVISYLKESLPNKQFTIDQKIILLKQNLSFN